MAGSTWGRDLVTALIGLWIVIGIHIDGWAHVHLLDLIDSFFTPWHASFYSGLAAFAAWLGFIYLKDKRLPYGYRAGAIGMAIFAVGGAVDLLWHELLGFEASIDALLSPPHLVLLTGVLLMCTTAWRSQRAASATTTIPELVALFSTVAITAFFLNYLSPFRWALPALGYTPHRGEDSVVMWIGGLVVTTAIIVIPTLWQIRDDRYRRGTLTVLTVAAGLGVAVAMSDGWRLRTLLLGLAAAAVGAFIGDLALAGAPWRQWRYGLPVVLGLTAFVMWGLQLIAYGVTEGIGWPVSLWGGSLIFAGAAAAALSSLLWRPPASR